MVSLVFLPAGIPRSPNKSLPSNLMDPRKNCGSVGSPSQVAEHLPRQHHHPKLGLPSRLSSHHQVTPKSSRDPWWIQIPQLQPRDVGESTAIRRCVGLLRRSLALCLHPRNEILTKQAQASPHSDPPPVLP